MRHAQKVFRVATILVMSTVLCSCSTAGKYLDPFYEAPSEEAKLGTLTDEALYENEAGGKKTALKAFEAMAQYRRANAAEESYPVVMPAVVRKMWVPDHLNNNGDLIPDHYYYLKVLSDRWAVQDAFELERQLGVSDKGSSNIPYVNGAAQ